MIDNQIRTVVVEICDSENPGSNADTAADLPTTPVGNAACIGVAGVIGADPEDYCATPELPVELLTSGLVAAAFRDLPLPPSELIVQPPNGRTLVNFDTNFYTETAPLDRTIRLFGQQVDLRIWPSSYEWHFGDGASTATESAGSPYPDLEITHNYTAKGQVGPAVDTTYSAEFRVNGGAWRPVPGTVTIPGDAVALEVVEATPVLVGYS
ncbi:hypothetical protein SAMN05192576_1794 [Nocardioides szechwanensis]|uniref:PKD domain-containing protein n=1 Tax=Nocardioides szechwanensis TaxID=1005944 RepID=A0A1G9ZN47_9ACTN|nr:hypothetical protein SAMN05192576_1794 [Nocardioides szechwanensis]